jgi:UDP-N-acetylmuramoyl-tripeptide--D-alanyl-D-alanine ligase
LLKSIPHRLELVTTSNGIITIDDSYNANPEGVKSALETLKFFEGKKYIVTPGIVELGFAEAEKNFELGVLASKVCDGVILIGRARALKIREGLLSEGYPTDKIIMVNSLEDAKQEISSRLQPNDVVLFENDLPDKYN